MPKLRRARPPKSEVISAPLFHFWPIFDSLLKKIVTRPPFQVGGAIVRLGHSLVRVKIWGAQHPLGAKIWSSEKCTLRGYDFTSKSPRSLDRTSPYLFCLMQEDRHTQNDYPILNIFIRFGDIRRRTSKSSEIELNFACFWPLNFFGVRPPKFQTSIIKFGLVLTIVQNFTPVGPRISEISRVEKNKKKHQG